VIFPPAYEYVYFYNSSIEDEMFEITCSEIGTSLTVNLQTILPSYIVSTPVNEEKVQSFIMNKSALVIDSKLFFSWLDLIYDVKQPDLTGFQV